MEKLWVVTKMYYKEGRITAVEEKLEEIENLGIFANLDLVEEAIANDAGCIDASFSVYGSFTEARFYTTSSNNDTVKYQVEAFEPKFS